MKNFMLIPHAKIKRSITSTFLSFVVLSTALIFGGLTHNVNAMLEDDFPFWNTNLQNNNTEKENPNEPPVLTQQEENIFTSDEASQYFLRHLYKKENIYGNEKSSDSYDDNPEYPFHRDGSPRLLATWKPPQGLF